MNKGQLGFSRFSLLGLILLFFSAGGVWAQSSTNTVEFTPSAPAALMQASYLGHHDPASTLNVTVVLKLHNTERLHQFLRALRDPTSPEYRQFLTPQQFDVLYGPTAEQVQSVAAYLKAQGLQVNGISSDNKLIFVTAQSGAIERAFGIRINDYEYKGRRVHATTDSPKFPASIAGLVEAVIGLSNLARLSPALVDSQFATSSSSPIGYSPLQIATAYNWPSITDASIGAGATIAIFEIDAPDVLSSDYPSFWNYYGLPNHSVTFTIVPSGDSPPDCGICDQEATLDIEYAGAMAPGATLEVYDGYVPANELAQTTSQLEVFVQMLDQIVNDDSAQVVTISYIMDEDSIVITEGNNPLQAADDEFMKATGQGMEIIAADGDGGSANDKVPPCTDTANVSGYPAADPYVLAAGGTTLTLNGNNTIASESAWSYAPYYDNTACLGTGGAASNYVFNGVTYWPEPSWQTGEGVPQNGYRNYSDMSMNADPNTPQSFYFESEWSPGDGTSIVAPELAGLIADEISLAGSANPLAQANSAIYIDANNHYSTDFHDVTSGNNGAYSAAPGWDFPTGWGSPKTINLIDHLSSGAAISDPQNLSAEYLGCRLSQDTYFVTWQPPQVGTASGGYDLEYEMVGQTDWHTIDYGPGSQANLKLPPSTQVGLRVRASNGTNWGAYNTDMFTTSACSPPP